MRRRRAWPRRLAILGVAAVVLALVLALLAGLALRSARGQQAVLAQLSQWTESELGVSLAATSFRLRPLRGVLDIEGLELRVPGEAPFARVARVGAHWRPLSLLRGRPLFGAIDLERPELDLRSPMPAGREPEPGAQPLDELPVVVERFSVREGSVTGAPVSDAVGGWELGAVTVEAGFDGRRVEVRELGTSAAVDLAARGRQVFEFGARATADLAGTAEIESLRLSGDGLSVDVTGRVGSAVELVALDFDVAIDPGVWLGDAASGPVHSRGEVDLGAWRGRAIVEGGRQPARLLADFLPPELAAILELDETTVAVDADLELVPERTVTGTVRLGGTRREERVLGITLRPRLELREEIRAVAEVEATVLTDEIGARRMTATLTSPDVTRLESWSIEDGVVAMDHPQVDRLARKVAALYPRLLDPASLDALPLLGSLRATGWFTGPLANPDLDVDVELRPHAGARVALAVAGQPVTGRLAIETEGSGLEVAHFTPAASGRLSWSGRVRDALGAATGSLALEAREVATADGRLLELLEAELAGDRTEIAWQLTAQAPSDAGFDAKGMVKPELPLASMTGEWTLATGDERLPRVDGAFELAAGALAVDLEATPTGRDPVTLDANVPLAALDALPQLSGLAEYPLARRDGAVTLGWDAPEGSWRELLPAALAERLGTVIAGSKGRLDIDLSCPACSRGSMVLSGLDLELDGRRVTAGSDLAVTLAEGRAELAPWALRGDGLALDVESSVELDRSWRLGDDPLRLGTDSRTTLTGRVESAWLEALPLEVVAPGALAVEAQVSGSFGDLSGAAHVEAPGLVVRPTAYPDLTLAEPTGSLHLAAGVLRWEGLRLAVGETVATSSGRMRWPDPMVDSAGRLDIVTGLPVLDSLGLPFSIRDGLLTIDEGSVKSAGGTGGLRAAVPLDGRPQGEARLEWNLPTNDWRPLFARLGAGEDPDLLELATAGSAVVPLEAPSRTTAAVELRDVRVVMRGRESRIEPAVALAAADGRLRLAPFTLISADERFEFEAGAELDPTWALGDDPAALLAQFDVRGTGEVDAGLLNPFLAGARAEGALGLDVVVQGSPEAYDGRIAVAGPEASLLFRSPYLARLSEPRLELAIRAGRIGLDSGSARLNEGTVDFSGVVLDDSGTDLRIAVSDALFRLDYGLLATLGADLRYRSGAEGRSTLSGGLGVERGSLTRSVQLDLDLLSQLLLPIDLTTTEDDPLDLVALDLEVSTREGVRVKNNLGDLLVRWEPLLVTGSLARPVIEGRVEVDPGGLLRVYGQTVRLDKAVIEYAGEEGAEPRLDFEATTSIEDPSIGRLAGADPFRTTAKTDEATGPLAGEVTADLARFYGEQFAGRLGESVGVSVSLRPLLIFGEADPGARLTVSRDLSPNLAIAASVDLRKAEGQTYLLELHELRRLPRLVAQAFTDDESDYGGALLQRQEFGGSKKAVEVDAPRVAELAVDPPPGVSKRGIKRALALDKGDRFDSRQRFLAEVELVDYLMRKGYPDAKVTVQTAAAGRRGRKVRLDIGIEPGPRVEFAFAGEKIPKPLRALIRSLYRPDFFEPESIQEMRAETVRALRSRGFLDPQVEIEVEPLDATLPGGDRRVVVSTVGGSRISPEPPVFLGLPDSDADVLGATFANAVQRVELAVGLESADRRLLRALADLGYPEAGIISRYESLDERRLTVEIEPGPRQSVASVRIEGGDGDLVVPSAELEPLLTIAAGDPLRRSALSRSAVAIERNLGSRGYLDARVRTVLAPADEDPHARHVRFVAETGELARLGTIEFTGLRSTRERWAAGVTELEPGQPLARDDLSQARTRLWRTGLFSGVSAEAVEEGPGRRKVVFDLAERDRYRLTYGVRWDSDQGLGAVFDATDDNFLGRAWTLGLRALSSSEENSLRWLTRVPRAFGGPGALEFFAAVREITETFFFGEVAVEILEGTLQYSHPVSQRTTFRAYGRYTDTTREAPFITLRVKNPQLGLQLLYDSRSPEPLTARGTFASVDLSGSQEFLGGDLRYARLFSQLNHYRPAGRVLGRRLSWSQSYRLGLAEAFGQQLIRDVRFFAGGEYSVRGYETESLGEQERFGSIVEPTGGAALLVVNQELRWRVFPDYTLVLFYDAGNVWQKTSDLGFGLFESAGIGLRAQTPVGLLRLDLAHALDARPEIDPEYKLYVGLGTTF